MNNGVKMPQIGYRSIDTAQCYGSEKEVGLACGQNGIWQTPALIEIARNHGKSVSQIALRFLLQQGIIVIPKSTNTEHMKENLSVLDFDLEADEMQAVEKLEVGRSLFNWW